MTKDDALFGYRQQVFALAGRTTVSEACRKFGIHRSTFYRLKGQVERHGLEMLRPRERRHPQMPHALPTMVEERILRFAIAHPGLGPRRVASELGRPKWGAIVASKNGVWRTLRRHGSRRGPSASPSWPATPPPTSTACDPRRAPPAGRSPGGARRLRLLLHRPPARHPPPGLAAHRDRHRLLVRLGRLVSCPTGHPTGEQTSKLARRVAAELSSAGWALERVLCDNGGESKSRVFGIALEQLGTRKTHIHAGRPQTNANVEALQRTILDECWRPAFARYLYVRFTGLPRELDTYLRFYTQIASTTAA